MLKNYFKVAWRTIRNNKAFSAINIIGLAFGMACSLLILLWVKDERSVDSFFANGDRVFRIFNREYVDGKKEAGYWTPGLLAGELKKNIPEIEYASGVNSAEGNTFEAGGKILKQDGLFADSDYFKILSYPLLQGNAETALNTPEAIALSDKMATKFFGDAKTAIGKTLRYQNRKDFKVTAVFADPPENSSLKFDFVINWMAYVQDNEWVKDWRNNSPSTFVLLRPAASPALVSSKLKRFLDNYNHTFTANFRLELNLQPFRECYLHSNFVDGELSGGRIEYVRLFSIVAVFILVIACINFMNLSTARSSKRSREIGIRKVAGALRGSLVSQFLSEAVFTTAIAVILAILLVIGLLPYFNTLTGKQIGFPFSDYSFWLELAGLTVLTGLVAGSYPAVFLSAFRPIKVLKGALKFKGTTILFRKGLVVFQFVLSIVLIVGTIVIARQSDYIQHANLGYRKENLLYIPLEGDLGGKYSVLKQQAMGLPTVQLVTCLSDVPTYIGGNRTSTVDWTGRDPNANPMFMVTAAGYDFVKTMQLTLVDGRDFSREFASDSSAYLVNEEAVKLMKYRDPIGKPMALWGMKGHIVGVLKNFHLTSLHQHIEPLIVHLGEANQGGIILVRTTPDDTKPALAGLEKICKELNPKFPFSYYFVDDEFQKLYKSESIASHLTNCFSVLAIFISCLGLLGLAMFTAEQRTREIGIRKVLGASLLSLFTLLSGEFLLLVVVAILIASPLAWWATNHWLEDYAYRVPVSWWIFGVAGGLAVFIALATVSFQGLKAALMNPVKSLRSDG
ncbi:MAG: ABC transporter permease [Puia sp.]|nr:ABC transporter permease [Puia sp.]